MVSSSNLEISAIKNAKILFPVLDWGLGHASRSLALANLLEKNGNQIQFASNGRTLAFLSENCLSSILQKPAFPSLSNFSNSIAWNLAFNFPKLLQYIQVERNWVKKVESSFDLIISDGCLGAYSKYIPSILVNHQLSPRVPKSVASLQAMSNLLFAQKMNQFQAIWVPAAASNLKVFQTELAQNNQISSPIYSLPILSRLKVANNITIEIKPVVVIVSSKTELLAEQLELFKLQLDQMGYKWGSSSFLQNVHLVWGANPNEAPEYAIISPSTESLAQYLQSAQHILFSGGFSTLMDIAVLNPNADLILCPPNGQTEQELFAKIIQQSQNKLL